MADQSPQARKVGKYGIFQLANFCRESWRLIGICTLIGLVIALGLLAIAQKQYEASVQIQVAQISINKISDNETNNPFGVNVEEAAVVVGWLKTPTAYSEDALRNCAVSPGGSAAEDLIPSLLFGVMKNTANIVEIRLRRSSREIAATCAQAIFNLVKIRQAELVKPLVEEAKKTADELKKAYEENKALLVRTDKSWITSAVYLCMRDEMRSQLEDIRRMENVVSSAAARPTRLLSPIYSSDRPAFPRPGICIALGISVGLMIGLLAAITRGLYLRQQGDGATA
ncbi:MAG: Wzz/FepE/Etk N-terminal domain-containing protein [Candidatus Protistobacter heckmanni]|nr:Wzz/FepE/Etk N-terminal domain-containing protein [Candidatus Protistobacter heckmanni]